MSDFDPRKPKFLGDFDGDELNQTLSHDQLKQGASKMSENTNTDSMKNLYIRVRVGFDFSGDPAKTPQLTAGPKAPVPPITAGTAQPVSPDISDFRSAFDYAASHQMAVAYLEFRHDDFTMLMRSLVWTYQTNKVVHITTPLVHGLSMNHELSPGELHASPCWGEIYDSRAEDTILFPTMETAMAYILARWW